MLRTVRRFFATLFFGPSVSSKLPALNEDQRFQLEQFQLGLMSEGDWQDLLARDPVLSAHFRFHHPEMRVEHHSI
jgi:hypothetical protein